MLYQLITILCCLWIVWRLWFKKKPYLEPPELSGRLPIVGHGLLLLGDSVRLLQTLQRISKECLKKGGLITAYVGPIKMYGVADPDDSLTIANTCLQKHYIYNFGKDLLGNGLFAADVLTWKKNRKLLNSAFNQQVLNGYIGIFNNQARKLMDQFSNKVGKPFDHKDLLRTNNLETICMTALGIETGNFKDMHELYLSRLENLAKRINKRVQRVWLHSDFMYNMTREKKIQETEIKDLLTLSKSIIEKKKIEKQYITVKENKGGKVKTFMDLILDLASSTACFTDEQIREETDNIIAGAHDTTATALIIAMVLLGSHNDVQYKAYDEITNALGTTDENIGDNDLSKLVYIEAIIKETLRLYPIAQILPRRIEKDIKLKNYTVTANSDGCISIYGLHRHSIWGPDADQFRPERWLDKETLPDLKYYGAFGLGRRSCIGKVYAMMSMKIVLAHMLRKYQVSSNISKMVMQVHMLIRPVSGHHITLTLRNKTV